jgi:hypothetical protein
MKNGATMRTLMLAVMLAVLVAACGSTVKPNYTSLAVKTVRVQYDAVGKQDDDMSVQGVTCKRQGRTETYDCSGEITSPFITGGDNALGGANTFSEHENFEVQCSLKDTCNWVGK